MLKKLFVHEWRSFWKVPAAMCLFALVYALVGALTFQTDLWNNDYRLVRLVLVFGSIGYFILLIAPAIILSIYTALRFYRNLFTDEGYLMHTLPVKKWELITAKGLVAVIWNVITTITTLLSVLLVILLISMSSRYGGVTWADITESFAQFFHEAIPIVKEMFRMPVWMVALLFLGSFIVGAFYNTLLLYASVSIGHLWKKHPMAGTVLSYIGFYLAISFLTSAFSINSLNLTMGNIFFASNYTAYASMGDYLLRVLGNGYLVSAIGILVFYAITEWIMSHKLNLD